MKRSMPPHTAESPAKKQSKWTPEEDALIIELRGSGMKWDDISKRLHGRSPISCRLHYQNYLERRSPWDEERKNKLARLYERFKPEMWQKVAEEMQVPWRAAEAMHWQMGENDMARRAGVIPFTLSSVGSEQQPPPPPQPLSRRESPPRNPAHAQQPQQPSMPRDYSGLPSPHYARAPPPPPPPQGHHMLVSIPPPLPTGSRPLVTRRDSGPPRSMFGGPNPHDAHHQQHHQQHFGGPGPGPGPGPDVGYGPGLGLAPIQSPGAGGGGAGTGPGSASGGGAQGRAGSGTLPSVAELTTGVSPYSTPAFSAHSSGGVSAASPAHQNNSSTASPSTMPFPRFSSLDPPTPGPADGAGPKRRGSPDPGRRRPLEPPSSSTSNSGA